MGSFDWSMSEVVAPADVHSPPPESASKIGSWVHGVVHEAQDLGKKAIQSKAGQQIRDSGQHIVQDVVERGKQEGTNARQAASAAGVVAHDAANGKIDPKHVVDAGAKIGETAVKASPHALVAAAVKDEAMRRVPLSQGTRDHINQVLDPKKAAADAVHHRVNEAVQNLPVLTIGHSHQEMKGAKDPKNAVQVADQNGAGRKDAQEPKK